MPAIKYTKRPINFFRTYSQFLVLCEHWEQADENQRSKENQISEWGLD